MNIFSVALEGSFLMSLNLSDNALGEKGVRAFGALLESQTCLEELYLMNDGISEEAARAVCELIPPTEKLRALREGRIPRMWGKYTVQENNSSLLWFLQCIFGEGQENGPGFFYDPKVSNNGPEETVNYQITSPKDLANSIINQAGWSNLLCKGKKIQQPLDPSLLVVGRESQSSDLSLNKHAVVAAGFQEDSFCTQELFYVAGVLVNLVLNSMNMYLVALSRKKGQALL